MERIVLFAKRGFNTLSSSSKGRYSEKTEDILALRREMLTGGFGSFRTDKENMMKDRRAISGDVGRAFSHISTVIN